MMKVGNYKYDTLLFLIHFFCCTLYSSPGEDGVVLETNHVLVRGGLDGVREGRVEESLTTILTLHSLLGSDQSEPGDRDCVRKLGNSEPEQHLCLCIIIIAENIILHH